MLSKISPSTVGVCERVSDSVQPVHSWNDSQITEGRLAFSRALAIAGTMDGGSAIIRNQLQWRQGTGDDRSVSRGFELIDAPRIPEDVWYRDYSRLK